MTTLTRDIQTIADAFATLDRIDPAGPLYARLRAILDAASDEALVAVHRANIRFASRLAFNRMIRRGLVGKEG